MARAASIRRRSLVRSASWRPVVLPILILLPACGGDADPIAPPEAQIPDVAGTYTGQFTVTSSLAGATFTGSMRIEVVQAGAQLTIAGSVTLLGATQELPAVTGTINATGFFTATAGGFVNTTPDPECGRWTVTSSTLTFSGSTARYVETATSESCGDFDMSGTLSR